MKRLLGLLSACCLLSATVYAQSTMPAMGANTPKGEVAKTDASVNQTDATQTSNASMKTKKSSSGKHTHKMKMTSNKPMGNM